MPHVRVSVTHNRGAKKPSAVATGHLKSLTHSGLLTFCRGKLKLKGKAIRLYICSGSVVAPSGTEIRPDTANLEAILTDGVLIAVAAKGDDFKSPDVGATGLTAESHMKQSAGLSRPPRWPHPGRQPPPPFSHLTTDPSVATLAEASNRAPSHDADIDAASDTDRESLVIGASAVEATLSPPSPLPPIVIGHHRPPCSTDMAMVGLFPVLAGNVLELVDAIAAQDAAIVKTVREADGWIIYDYRGEVPVFADPTAAPNQRDRFARAVHRECRGLVLSAHTGAVLSRRFHKFFNLGEREETVLACDALVEASCFDKLDGQLCSPVPLHLGGGGGGGGFGWATRTMRSERIEAFVADKHEYSEIAAWAAETECTPLFEWCPDTHVVGVLRHSAASLTLLAIRDNVTGEYIDLDDLCVSVPAVAAVPMAAALGLFSDLDMDGWIQREGVVLCLPDGRRYKAKCGWYVAMANASKHGGSSGFLPELLKSQSLSVAPTDKVWLTALENADDVVAACVAALASKNAHSVDGMQFLGFVSKVNELQSILAADLVNWATDAFATVGDASVVATYAYQTAGWPLVLTRAALRGTTEVVAHLRRLLCELARAERYAELDALLGVSWEPGVGVTGGGDRVLTALASYDDCGEHTVRGHVLSTYLPRKISQLMGKAKSPRLLIPRSYAGDEGKIVGLFEAFRKHDVHDLRVDLQPSRKDGPSEHYGSAEHALLLVQYGIAGTRHPSGNLAGVLVPTECEVSTAHVISAMEMSFDTRKPVQLARRTAPSKVTVFCDLDGVLADFERGVRELTGRATADQPIAKMWQMWQRILNRGGFFRTLPWLPYGQKLWRDVISMSPTTPIVLTGLPFNAKKQVHREKQGWCKEHLGAEVAVICCKSREKAERSGPGSILIDDNAERRKEWELYGGTFIHHVRPDRTVYELARALGKLAATPLPPACVGALAALQDDVLRTTVVTDVWPLGEGDDVVGLDCEWSGDTALCLVQLAVTRGVFIVDVLSASMAVKERLRLLLMDSSVLKVGFSLSNDVPHLGHDIVNAVCLQEMAVDQLRLSGLRGKLPSLSDFASVLGLQLSKDKGLQNGDWAARPLATDMLMYAANDAAIVLHAHTHLVKHGVRMPSNDFHCGRVVHNGPGQEPARPDFDPSAPVSCVYSAVFLSPASRAELLATYPTSLKTQRADHVTLAMSPTEAELRGLPVGQACEVTIVGPVASRDGQVEALYVTDLTVAGSDAGSHLYKAIARPHITMSTGVGISPALADRLDFSACGNAGTTLRLLGVIGIVVAEQTANPLAALPTKLRSKIESFAEDAMPGESLRFHPHELMASDRRVLHAFAEERGMESRSEGREDQRRLTLVMRRRRGAAPCGSNDLRTVAHARDDDRIERRRSDAPASAGKTRRVTDFSRFAELNIVSLETEEGTPANHVGTVALGGSIEWASMPIAARVAAARIVVLRGLPGSGKSTVARHLAGASGVVYSADGYFEAVAAKRRKKGDERATYATCFAVDQLADAHEWCFQQFTDALAEVSGRTSGAPEVIVIDNTNSTRTEYTRYVQAAADAGMGVTVIELETTNKTTALACGGRSAHSVPVRVILRMLSRWERDDEVLLLKPHSESSASEVTPSGGSSDGSCLSFRNWASHHHLFHFNKRRRRTHVEFAHGTRPLSYVDVPPRLTPEFLRCYASAADVEEPKYLAEVVGERFRFFVDVDAVLHAALTPDEIAELARAVHSVCCGGKGRVLVTGQTRGQVVGESMLKVGLHIKTPDLVVNATEALALRSRLVQHLQGRLVPGHDWNATLDPGLYTAGSNLRMLGSRKVTRGVDVGRVYTAVLLMESDGTLAEAWPQGVALLELASIHPPSI